MADDAVLLTSELVTNAIAHTASGKGGKVLVTVYRDDTRARVEVHDDGSDQAPVVQALGEARESGFGLGLVALMADRWGHCGGRGLSAWCAEARDGRHDRGDCDPAEAAGLPRGQ